MKNRELTLLYASLMAAVLVFLVQILLLPSWPVAKGARFLLAFWCAGTMFIAGYTFGLAPEIARRLVIGHIPFHRKQKLESRRLSGKKLVIARLLYSFYMFYFLFMFLLPVAFPALVSALFSAKWIIALTTDPTIMLTITVINGILGCTIGYLFVEYGVVVRLERFFKQ